MQPKMRGKKTRGGRNRRVDTAEVIRQKDIHSRLDGLPSGSNAGHSHNLHGTSNTAIIADAAKFNECATIEERPDTHGVSGKCALNDTSTLRQSVTRKQLLGVFPQQIETAPIPTRQLDRKSGKMVETSDNRLTWKSDRTLLRRGNPFKDPEASKGNAYKRDGSVSVGLNKRNYRAGIPNADPQPETVIGPALDDDIID